MKKGLLMTIAGLPIQQNQPVNSITVGTAVLAKNLDMVRQSGEDLIKMMEQSVQPDLGQNIDMKL
jgi:hypothetical protein